MHSMESARVEMDCDNVALSWGCRHSGGRRTPFAIDADLNFTSPRSAIEARRAVAIARCKATPGVIRWSNAGTTSSTLHLLAIAGQNAAPGVSGFVHRHPAGVPLA